MYSKKDLLLQSAARLYTLGVDVENAREELRRLVSQNVPYDSPRMIAALKQFEEAKQQWDDLEKAHLNLKKEIQ